MKMVKWKDLNPAQLRDLATELRDAAHDKKADRESLADEMGWDLVGGLLSLARRIDREANRRERGAVGTKVRPIGYLCDALKGAYRDVEQATHVLQQAGVDLAQIRTDQPIAKVWTDALKVARAHDQLDALVAVVLADPNVSAFHDQIREAARR